MPTLAPPPLDHRHLIPERMDDPHLDPGEHRRALRGLERLNRFGGALRLLWPPVREAAAQLDCRSRDRPLRVLDVACGGGDIAIYLDRRARNEGLPLQVAGCDLSDTALEHARSRAAAAQADVEFFGCDVLTGELPTDYDVILTSQFLHHLQVDDAVSLVAAMAAHTRHTLLVSDLARSRRNLWLTTLAAHVLTRSPVVHFDGPQSIRAAFTLDEAREIAAQADLGGHERIEVRWPVHFLLSWSKPAERRGR